MVNTDVRDLAGRTWRVIVACVIGSVGSVAIAAILPMRNHFSYWWENCFSGGDSVDIALVIAGAALLSLGCYVILEALAAASRAATARDRGLSRSLG